MRNLKIPQLLDLIQEKPVGFVSYGGVSGGTRAVQELKLTITTLE